MYLEKCTNSEYADADRTGRYLCDGRYCCVAWSPLGPVAERERERCPTAVLADKRYELFVG